MQTTDPFAAEMLRASATGLADLASGSTPFGPPETVTGYASR